MDQAKLAQTLRAVYDDHIAETPTERWNAVAAKVMELSGVEYSQRHHMPGGENPKPLHLSRPTNLPTPPMYGYQPSGNQPSNPKPPNVPPAARRIVKADYPPIHRRPPAPPVNRPVTRGA